jgi:hypothetical protein
MPKNLREKVEEIIYELGDEPSTKDCKVAEDALMRLFAEAKATTLAAVPLEHCSFHDEARSALTRAWREVEDGK